MKDRQSLLPQLGTLLPLAVEWGAAEQRVLREGVPVLEQEMADAKWAGVRDSSKLEVGEGVAVIGSPAGAFALCAARVRRLF